MIWNEFVSVGVKYDYYETKDKCHFELKPEILILLIPHSFILCFMNRYTNDLTDITNLHRVLLGTID